MTDSPVSSTKSSIYYATSATTPLKRSLLDLYHENLNWWGYEMQFDGGRPKSFRDKCLQGQSIIITDN